METLYSKPEKTKWLFKKLCLLLFHLLLTKKLLNRNIMKNTTTTDVHVSKIKSAVYII